MTFVNATILGYANEADAQGNETAIVVTGKIHDDAWSQDYVGAYRIDGPALAALPAPNPSTDGQPTDARFQAIQVLIGKFVKAKHTELAALYATPTVVTPKPSNQVAALPAITDLSPF